MQDSRYYQLKKMWREYLTSAPALQQADRWLTDYFRKNKRFGSRDRKLYSESFFAALRFALPVLRMNLPELDEENLEPESYPAHFLNIPDDVFFSDLKIFASFLPIGSRELSKKEITNRFCSDTLPAWLREHLLERKKRSNWDSSLQKSFLEQLESKPPLYIRLNYPERKSHISKELQSAGFEIQETSLENCLALKGALSVFELSAFKRGEFEIQDLASQYIGQMVDAHPGMMIWDACAGGGGKTIQLASALQNRGRVYASDIREWKLDDIRKRARRARFSNIVRLPWNGEQLPEFPKEVKKRGGFHRILVDAPCSSSGTMRRNPDVRYRLHRSQLQELTELQFTILQNASGALRPGGKLIYATCSFIPAENEEIAEKFIRLNPNFQMEKSSMHGSPSFNADCMYTSVFVKSSLPIANDLNQ
ncbi:MAG: RsmB/NOP family class I SAM-dependent RNA methyltransferase [Leptospiraceae bacterium]|nr:RsmB/NOP family class I SAM-dependent RNA methyltransferase [Leptospiraceae bacterium]